MNETHATFQKSKDLDDDLVLFTDLFNLPDNEIPLLGWQAGRRAISINKDKPFTSAFKHGRLYLTKSYLCFERTKFPSPKNIVLPLQDIRSVERTRPYPWMPGGGMALGIELLNNRVRKFAQIPVLSPEYCLQSFMSTTVLWGMTRYNDLESTFFDVVATYSYLGILQITTSYFS